ncbi:MAG: hypothetical protein QOD76_1160 [Solirubrobacteraceae bacterium]|jgi:hypothetical protein|nr:hypothetical protein [Solirubrobacteraceae bacterium]
MPDGPDRPAEPATPDSSGKRSSSRTLGLVLGAVLIAAAGVGGYFLGDSAADASGAKKEGIAKGRAQALAQYKPGAAGYQAIYQTGQGVGQAAGQRTGEALGVRRGERVGLEQGKATGEQQGQAQGVPTGAQAALGNLSNWETGTFYVVKLQPGTLKGVTYQVQARTLMQANRLYEICTDNPGEVCSRAAVVGP